MNTQNRKNEMNIVGVYTINACGWGYYAGDEHNYRKFTFVEYNKQNVYLKQTTVYVLDDNHDKGIAEFHNFFRKENKVRAFLDTITDEEKIIFDPKKKEVHTMNVADDEKLNDFRNRFCKH
jgi:hypothetical protein